MPVVLGYDYRDTYKTGDMIPYFDSVTLKIKKYIVRGILEEDTSLLYKINTVDDISLTVFVQNFMIICVGAIASLGFIKAKYSSINAMFLVYILILILIISIITSITPIRVIRKLNVNELIRSGE